MKNNSVFFLSSLSKLSNFLFQGYMFSGADFIAGEKSAHIYMKAKKTTINPGLDGCYIVLNKINSNTFKLGVDYDGYKKLFYYNKNNYWAVSNSYLKILNFLRDNNIKTTPDEISLSSLKISHPLTSQLATYETLTKGIYLLPKHTNIIIKDNNMYFEKIRNESQPGLDYKENLAHFISLWLSRYETLLNDKRISISIDLTGGRDSRVAFAFLIRAHRRLGKINARLRINSSTLTPHINDLTIARELTTTYKLEQYLNKNINLERYSKISKQKSFDTYLLLNTGIYYPIYFPGQRNNNFDIRIHGAGGENYRIFYEHKSISHFTNIIKTDDYNLKRWLDRLEKTTTSLSKESSLTNPWMAHYREFMGRIHAGRAPQYCIAITPLCGSIPSKLSELPNIAENAQLHFDCMESLVPNIINFAYDTKKKHPTDYCLNNITTVEISSSPSPGTVYIDDNSTENSPTISCKEEIDYLYYTYKKAISSEAIKFMPDIVASANKSFSNYLTKGEKSFLPPGKEISKIIAFAYAIGDIK